MTATDELLANNEAYAASFDEGNLPLHHTERGMLTFTDDEFETAIHQKTGAEPEWSAECFSDLEEDVRQSIGRIKASPFILRTDSVRGFIYDVETGRLREVA